MFHDFELENAETHQMVPLSTYANGPVLLCTLIPKCFRVKDQIKQLEALNAKFENLNVLGVFSAHHRWTSDEDAVAIYRKQGATFPLFKNVNIYEAKDRHPLFAGMVKRIPYRFGKKNRVYAFHKFLITKEGKPIQRFPKKVDEALIKSCLPSANSMASMFGVKRERPANVQQDTKERAPKNKKVKKEEEK